MKQCDLHQPLPNAPHKRWPPGVLDDHVPGGLIYVHATALADFARRGLRRITSPFVLVTGNHVSDLSRQAIGDKAISRILEHPHLIAWYAQNLAMTHPKAHVMPLGLDYHTIAARGRPEWGAQADPVAQEVELMAVRGQAPELNARNSLGYSNWHFVPDNGDRAEVLERLDQSVSFYEPDPLERAKSWKRNANYAFTISPRGRGMDCHRTWEAILLGAVPVIPDLPINSVFKGLPVVIVRDWAGVTVDFLAVERERVLAGTFDFAPLLLEFWRKRMRGQDVPKLVMTYQEFMDLTAADFAPFQRP